MPDMINCTIKLFADDTKLSKGIHSDLDRLNLQDNINKMCEWTQTWLMKLNISKCKYLEVGTTQGNHQYQLQQDETTSPIQKVSSEKDLGVYMDHSLQFSVHANQASTKANRMIRLVFRTFSYMSPEMFLTLYKTLIRPHLEYATPVTSPILQKDKITIENVQRRATKRIPALKDLTYEERLKRLGLPTLEYRRMRADIIQTFKILKGIDILDVDKLFQETGQRITRGHSRKLFKKQRRLQRTGHFFSNRIVNTWNSLPEKTVTSTSVNSFKTNLNKAWHQHRVKFKPSFT
ncbi:uncharacterized protein [Argopecten irradians]|uniref:uncharacterized protein n=1 Tax=Argopecten irradians TaxID=31199 RepID=UPI00371C62C8